MFQASCATTALCLYFGTGRLFWFRRACGLIFNSLFYRGLGVILFLDKKIKIFLWRRETPPRLRRNKKSIDNILGGYAAGPQNAAP